MGDPSRKRRAESREGQQNKRHHHDDINPRLNRPGYRGEPRLFYYSDRDKQDDNLWREDHQSARGRGSSPKGRPRSPPRRPHSLPRRPDPPPPRPRSPPPHLNSPPRGPRLPAARLQGLARVVSDAIVRKYRPDNNEENKSDGSTRYGQPSGQKDVPAESQAISGESHQDSAALAEEFLQNNTSLLHAGYGTEYHDSYEAHLQEWFKVPDFLTVRGLGSHPEASSLVRAQVPAPMKQESEINDKDTPFAQAVLPSTLSLEEQLPFLKIEEEGAISDDFSPPNLLAPTKPSLTNSRMAFVEVTQSRC